MFRLTGISRSSSIMSIFGGPSNLSKTTMLARPPIMPMRPFSCSSNFLAKKGAVSPLPLHTATRPTPTGPSTKPPASKSATFLPESTRISHSGSHPPMPGTFQAPSSHHATRNVNAHEPLGCFRYRTPHLDIVSESFGSLQAGSISTFLTQAANHKGQIGEGINLLLKDPGMAPVSRVVLFSRYFDKAWQNLTAATDVNMIEEGIRRKMSEVEGHPTKLLLHSGHWCINDNMVSTTATALYGTSLRHAETQFVILDNLRERILVDLVSIQRSGQNSFPCIDLAIKALTLLPDGSFNMPAFKQLKAALNIEEGDQVARHFGRQACS